jgi:hypothetical protein
MSPSATVSCCSTNARSPASWAKTSEKGLTVVPLKIYFKGGRIKIEIGLARGKKLHDKRATLRRARDQAGNGEGPPAPPERPVVSPCRPRYNESSDFLYTGGRQVSTGISEVQAASRGFSPLVNK